VVPLSIEAPTVSGQSSQYSKYLRWQTRLLDTLYNAPIVFAFLNVEQSTSYSLS
jgi:hypothetical protein